MTATPSRPTQGADSGSPSILQPGTRAPDFKLNATPDQKVCPSDFKGMNLVMIFYPADWSPVCTDEMVLFNELLPEFRRHNAELIGISVDGTWCHIAFHKNRKLQFPLLSDFEPKGAVSKAYGVYRPEEGISERALFVVDGQGMIRWSYLSPLGVNPGADGVLEALAQITGKPAIDGAPAPPPQKGATDVRFARADSKPGVSQGQSRPRTQDTEVHHGDRSAPPDSQSTHY